jgi:zinc protease
MKNLQCGRLAQLAIAVTLGLVVVPAASFAQTSPETASKAEATGIPAWNIPSPDVEADPAVRFGILPNGMRYAIMRHDNPKGAASLRFAVRVGMKDEGDDQRGAAHFVEHMAFNGSRNIPEGQLIPMLERLGLAFGADTNAETDLAHTIYKLDLPNTNTETLEAGLGMMREVAGNLSFASGAVERERGVLLSEASMRNNQARRRTENLLTAALPGNRLGARVAASSDRIKTMSAVELRAFYEAYYRPDRVTLAIVGDVDPVETERKIVSLFSSWKPVGMPGPEYRGPVEQGAAPRFAAFSDPAIPDLISFDQNRPYREPLNSQAERRDDVLEAMAGTIITNRFWAITQKPETPVPGALFVPMEFGRNLRTHGLIVVAREGHWSEALSAGEQELRRALEHGFTQAEVDQAKANAVSTLNGIAEQARSRSNAAIASSLVAQSLSNRVVSSPGFDLATYHRFEASITPESVAEAFRKVWRDSSLLIHVSTKTPLADAETVIGQSYSKSAAVAVAAPVEKAAGIFAYESFGAPGKIVSDSFVHDLGIRKIRFANGLQLNLKRTNWARGQIAVRMEVGPGAQAFPIDKPGLNLMTALLMPEDGLKAHDAMELQQILAGRGFSLDLQPAGNALISKSVMASSELELQLKLFAARLSASAFRKETKGQWEPAAKALSDVFAAQPGQLLQLVRDNLLTGGDGRLGLPDLSVLTARTFVEMQTALKPQLQKGAVAISLVGDLEAETAIAAVAGTVGALPKRPERIREKYSYAPVIFRVGGTYRIAHTGQADQGAISLSWPTDDDHDQRDSQIRRLLAAAMELKAIELVREQLGASYSPDAKSFDQATYPGFGHISIAASAGIGDMVRIAKAFRQIANELRDRPISADLLRRAREPILASEARSSRDNVSLAEIAASAQSRPEILDRWRSRIAVLESLTPADIQKAAQRYLDPAKEVEILVVPKAELIGS